MLTSPIIHEEVHILFESLNVSLFFCRYCFISVTILCFIQVLILQAVVKEKDVRFQDQILKHEQELLNLTQVSNDPDLQQVCSHVWIFDVPQREPTLIFW